MCNPYKLKQGLNKQTKNTGQQMSREIPGEFHVLFLYSLIVGGSIVISNSNPKTERHCSTLVRVESEFDPGSFSNEESNLGQVT
jgi:hypothetical protein